MGHIALAIKFITYRIMLVCQWYDISKVRYTPDKKKDITNLIIFIDLL